MAKQAGKIEHGDSILTFCLGGNAYFTLESKVTGKRFTFRMRRPDEAGVVFVSVLNGPDNWTNYGYLGFIRGTTYVHGGHKAKISSEAPSALAFAWFWKRLASHPDKVIEQMAFWHNGKCGHCGRHLTVPESVATGLGPDCAAELGVPWQKPSTQMELGGMRESAA
jgi:hypothetical protein